MVSLLTHRSLDVVLTVSLGLFLSLLAFKMQ